MFTRKAVFYFSLATILLILALLFEDWQLAVLVLPVAAMFFLTNVWGFPQTVDLELDRRIVPDETFGSENIRVTVRVRNRGLDALGSVEVLEQLPAGIQLEKGTNHVHTRLQPGEAFELGLEFPSPIRGHYPIGPLTVRARDPIDLYLYEVTMDPDILAVLPRPERIRGTELRPRHVGPWPGTIPSRASGQGTEFYSLRGYTPGDDMKRINWKASARANTLIVNEMEAERVTDVMLVLDTEVSHTEASELDLFERSVRAATSMARLLLRQGNRVGLILQGSERSIVPPGFGKRQERRIIYILASAKPGKAVIPTSYVVTLLARLMLPAKAQIAIISPLLDPGLTEGIRELSAEGYSIIVISPIPEEPRMFRSEAEKIAYRIFQLERANTIMAVEKVSTLVQWPAGVPMSRILGKAKGIRRPIPA